MEAEPRKADPPKRKRRWFQFSLRTLMIGVTVLAVPCGYVGWQAKIVRERTAWDTEYKQCHWPVVAWGERALESFASSHG
jgi:hypothetical protein